MASSKMLSADRLIASIERDVAMLAKAARKSLETDIPTCPGWTVSDLLIHLGRIHREKEATVSKGLSGDDFNVEEPVDDPVDWFEEGAELMLKAFRAKDPAGHCWTWYGPDQTVRFWIRRMAHETLIHRVDAQIAHGPTTAVDPEIAEDGIDEALEIFIEGYPQWATFNRGDGVIKLSSPVRSWHLRTSSFSGTSRNGRVFDRFPTVILESESNGPDCTVSGDAAALDLWLWGRGPVSDLEVQGDPDLASYLRNVAARST